VVAPFVTVCQVRAAPIVYAASTFDGLVYKIEPSGKKSIFASGLNQPNGIAIDGDGNLYVAEVGRDRITKITPTGDQSIFYQFPNSRDNPEALAFGPDGSLFVGGTINSQSQFDPNYVYRISTGVASPYAVVGVQENLGIAIASDGVMYVSDLSATQSAAIWKVSGENQSEIYAQGGFVLGPWGLALDRQSRIYAADALGGVIDRFTGAPNGVERSVYAEILQPYSLAFDRGGRLFVGQEDSVSIITPGGQQRVLASGFSSVRGIAISEAPDFEAPEPTSLALVVAAFIGIGLATRRRNASRVHLGLR
jgi:sugar lactone lactonase YvrE